MSNNTTIPPIVPTAAETLLNGICTLTFGSISLFANALTIVTVLKKPSLRTPCFALIATEAAFNWIFAIAFVNDGVQRLGAFSGGLGNRYGRLACAFMSMPKLVTASVSYLSCVISIDRMIGITKPHKYEVVGRKTAVCGIIGAILIGATYIAVAMATLPQPINAVIACATYVAAYHPNFGSNYKQLGVVFDIVLVVVYAFTMSVIHRRKQIYATSSDQAQSSQILRRQQALMPAIRIMVASNIIFSCSVDIGSMILTNLESGRYLPRSALYTGILKAIGTVSDFFVLIMMSNEFRKGLKFVLTRSKQTETKIVSLSGARSAKTG